MFSIEIGTMAFQKWTRHLYWLIPLTSTLVMVRLHRYTYIRSFEMEMKMEMERSNANLSSGVDDGGVSSGADDGGACSRYNGVLLITRGSRGAAGATVFFTYVINQIIYAERNNLIPWIHLDDSNLVFDPQVHGNTSPSETLFSIRSGALVPEIRFSEEEMVCKVHEEEIKRFGLRDGYPGAPVFPVSIDPKFKNFTLSGNGVWQSYFDPISNFSLDDPSCRNLNIVEIPSPMLIAMHECAPWSVRNWVYNRVPLALRPLDGTRTHEWFGEMRQKGANVVKRRFRVVPWLQARIDSILKVGGKTTATACLAMHVRHTDKGHGRRKIPLSDFLLYAKAYVEGGGEVIFLATDSSLVRDEINATWPAAILERIRIQPNVLHSNSSVPTFRIGHPHAINSDILTDIYVMAKCDYLLHGYSAVTEAVMYINPAMHNSSINFDDPFQNAPSPESFRDLVAGRVATQDQDVTPESFRDLVAGRVATQDQVATSFCVNYDALPRDYVIGHKSFLPSTHVLTTRCQDDAADKFRAVLQRRQNPLLCDARKQVAVISRRGGFGGLINSWMKPFMYAQRRDLQMWSPELGYYSGEQCGINSTACWFEPLTRCETVHHLENEESNCSQIHWKDQKCVGAPVASELEDELACNVFRGRNCIRNYIKPEEVMKNYSRQHRNDEGSLYQQEVPGEFRRMGHFWYYNQLLSFLLRPNDNMKQALERTKEMVGWSRIQRPMLSLHVRHGDSCLPVQELAKRRKCEELESYMKKIIPIAKKYGVKSIYLATDSEKVIGDTKNYTDFVWFYQPLVPSSRQKVAWDRIVKGTDLDTYKAAQETLIDLFLLAEGDIFVGKFTSNIDRLAYSLLTIRLKGLAPYLSLDSSWCFDWGISAGRSDLGSFDC